MELATFGNVISELHWKGTFDFTEIINNFGLQQGTTWQIVRFILHFSLREREGEGEGEGEGEEEGEREP